MDAKQILDQILLGKTVTVALDYEHQLATLKSAIHKAKAKMQSAYTEMGLGDASVTEDQAIVFKKLVASSIENVIQGITVSIYLQKPEAKQYTIISVADTPSD